MVEREEGSRITHVFGLGGGAYHSEPGEEEMLVLEKEFSDGHAEFEVLGAHSDKMSRSWTDVQGRHSGKRFGLKIEMSSARGW